MWRKFGHVPLKIRGSETREVKRVPRRARIQGSLIVVSLNSRLESSKEEEEVNRMAPADFVEATADAEAGAASEDEEEVVVVEPEPDVPAGSTSTLKPKP